MFTKQVSRPVDSLDPHRGCGGAAGRELEEKAWSRGPDPRFCALQADRTDPLAAARITSFCALQAEYDTSSPLADEVAKSTGAILAGRGWYEVASGDRGGAVAGIYGGAWSGPVVVLTHHPEQLASDAAVEVATDIETGLARAQELAAGRDVGIFGGDVARQVLALGRLDEMIVQVVPIVLGGGVPLFGNPPGRRVALERVHFGASGVLTDMRFRVLSADRD